MTLQSRAASSAWYGGCPSIGLAPTSTTAVSRSGCKMSMRNSAMAQPTTVARAIIFVKRWDGGEKDDTCLFRPLMAGCNGELSRFDRNCIPNQGLP
jgi:hypothetical protein